MNRVPDRVMLIAARFTACKTNARIDTALFIIVTNARNARNRRMYDIVSDADCVLRSRT